MEYDDEERVITGVMAVAQDFVEQRLWKLRRRPEDSGSQKNLRWRENSGTQLNQHQNEERMHENYAGDDWNWDGD